jgi:glyoxylase-like metal-dependent hydrolase (beta-lactamase superfamily II)
MIKEFQVIYPQGGYQVNCYLLTCPQTKKTALIDMGGGADEIIEYLNAEKLKLEYIVITHLHADHFEGIPELLEGLNESIPVYSFKERNSVANKFLQDGDELRLGELTMRVIHTPGHTPNAICLYTDRLLFAGDSLDVHCGSEMVAETIKYLEQAKVPDGTMCYRGHELSATLGMIRKQARPVRKF